MRRRRIGLMAAALGLAVPGTGAIAQSGPIKIGDVNSFSSMALFTEPYRRGAELAVEEFNAAGGAGGRPMQVIFKDDAAKPGDAIRQAEELVGSDKVSAPAGGFTHDMDVVFGHADRVIVLNRGRVIAAGSPAEIRTDPQVQAV